MSDAVDRGITVTEIAAMDQPIDVCPESTAAFIGRALRGPLNTPVLVQNFGEFRRRFGDVWGRSSLGPAARQFFEHGGKRLFVIRVANNARGAMLCLPASGSALVMRAVDPGSTEFIRAAVDFDGIDQAEDSNSLFNLTLQRVNPINGLLIDQEIFKTLSVDPQSPAFVADELMSSSIARVEHPFPTHRPERTTAMERSYESTYVDHTQAGTDGVELSNYDLIGSRRDRSGLFALDQVEGIDLLYLPPPGKGKDVGPAAVLAAELYSRERGAMLIVDPVSDWRTPDSAVAGVRDLGYASPNMLGYFPRVQISGSDDDRVRPVGGAIAGLVCKVDRTYGPWHGLNVQGLGLDRHFRPEVNIGDEDAELLTRAGLNVIVRAAAGKVRLKGSVTMGRGSEVHRDFVELPARRLCLKIVNTIAKATRWAAFETADDVLTDRLRCQVLTYLHCLGDLGAFANDDFIVQCDVGVSHAGRSASNGRGVTILLLFQPVGCSEPISLTLHQSTAGLRVGSTAFGLSIRRDIV